MCFRTGKEKREMEREGGSALLFFMHLPSCWGTEMNSAGRLKSAILAREMPHLKEGAQK